MLLHIVKKDPSCSDGDHLNNSTVIEDTISKFGVFNYFSFFVENESEIYYPYDENV